LANITEGDNVTFTWIPNKDYKKGIEESSWSESGSISNPEFQGKLKRVN
jgi:hypothetical protein